MQFGFRQAGDEGGSVFHGGNLHEEETFAERGFHKETVMAAKTSPSQRKTMGRVMHEYAHGELKSGPEGKAGKVKSRRQAIAIALKESGASKYESKTENKRNLGKSKRKEAAGKTAQQEREGKSRVGARGKRESTKAMGGKNAKTTARRTPKQRAAAKRNIRKAQTARRKAA
jgi:hypothetical protein